MKNKITRSLAEIHRLWRFAEVAGVSQLDVASLATGIFESKTIQNAQSGITAVLLIFSAGVNGLNTSKRRLWQSQSGRGRHSRQHL
jgi:hypothetical protein